MTRLIINADDFGYSKGVNYGIKEAHLNGTVTSATLMANMSGFDHALELMKDMPDLGVGIHLTLTMGRPVLEDVDQLMQADGTFKNRLHYTEQSADLNQLHREWKAQIEKVLNKGVSLTHIDSHHHVHSLDGHLEVVKRLSEEYSLPVRPYNGINNQAENKKYILAEEFWNLFYYPPIKDMSGPFEGKKKELMEILEKDAARFSQYSLVEAMSHPGFIDTEVYAHSSYNLPRMREVEILTSKEFRQFLNEYGFELMHYGKL